MLHAYLSIRMESLRTRSVRNEFGRLSLEHPPLTLTTGDTHISDQSLKSNSPLVVGRTNRLCEEEGNDS